MNLVKLENKLCIDFGVNPLFMRARKKQFLKWEKQGSDILESEIKKLMKSKSKPFVKWVGGKRQLAKQFRELGLYPPSNFDPTVSTYYEPFVGKLEFDVTLIPYEGKDDWIESKIYEIKECLESNKIPKSGSDCDFCTYRNAIYNNESK